MIETKCLEAVLLGVLFVQSLSGCALERGPAIAAQGADSQIRADVQALIDQHPDLGPPNRIDVHVKDHVVYLSGLVNTDLTIANAQALALQAPGVTRVINSIAVED